MTPSEEVPEVITNVRNTIAGGRVLPLVSGVLFRQGKPWSRAILISVSLAMLATLIAMAAYAMSAVQDFLKPTAPTKYVKLKKAEILMTEVDDFMTVVVNDDATFQSEFGKASDWIDITRYLKQGANKIQLTIVNGQYGGCGGRLTLRMNDYVASDHDWTFGTARGINEGRLPNVMCYTQVKTIVLN